MKKKPTTTNTIEAPEADYLYTLASQITQAGLGLYTAIAIYKGEVIAVFLGEILTEKQVLNRIKHGNDKYFISMLDGSIMDSMKTKCFAKYANDAQGFDHAKYTTNSKIEIDELGRVCLIATRNIKAGEEIFCSYGKRYWQKHGSTLPANNVANNH
jgi:uncharacterized protein